MHLGIAASEPGDVFALADLLPVKWVSIELDVSGLEFLRRNASWRDRMRWSFRRATDWFDKRWRPEQHRTRYPLDTLMAAADEIGARVVVDAKTTMKHLGTMLYDPAREPMENRRIALDWYAQAALALLERYPQVANLEIWGGAEVARIVAGEGMLLDYSTVLVDLHEAIKAARPDVRIWTGSFGLNANLHFLEYGIAVRSPHAFDVCNLEPYITSSGVREQDEQTISHRLAVGRRCLDDNCSGQPYASSRWGIPTVPCRPNPRYGQFVRVVPSVRGLPYEVAGEHYRGMLGVFAEAGFEVVCLQARDNEAREKLHDWAGLLEADGTPKTFVGEIAEGSE